jgi:formate--tetrahydrofolate ligase
MKSSLEIAQQHELVPIETLAARIGLLPDEVEPYGRYKAKLSLAVLERRGDAPDGKLVCVTGMTPTKMPAWTPHPRPKESTLTSTAGSSV